MSDKLTKQQILAEHLRALRRMLIISVAAVGIAFVAMFYLACAPLVDFVLQPLRVRAIEVVATHVSEALVMQIKTCLVAAVVAAMPVIMGQIWWFIAPALYPSEKRLFAALFFAALLLFLCGVVFSYIYVFPLAIDLFFEATEGVATTLWSVDRYFDFVLSFVLPFGLMFELPVAIFMMAKRGWVDYAKLAKNRKFVLLAIAVVAAVLTPPDVVSQVMLGIPMYLLYEISVQITRFVKPTKKPETA